MDIGKCPYDDKPCPKLDEINKKVVLLENDLKTISRYLYLIIGMVAINWGISLW